jgi:hypothetical protein
MKTIKLYIFLYIGLFLIFSCKRDKDEVIYQTVRGQVYNNCTDSGLANVTVYLYVLKNNVKQQTYQSISGADGSFVFPNAEIHSNEDFSYSIYIPSESGTAGIGISFIGSTVHFNKNETGKYFISRVIPGFYLFKLEFNQLSTGVASDSIVAVCSQYKYHTNVPYYPFEIMGKCYGNVSYQFGNIGEYPMGKWNISIDKWKSGVHTTINDSIYIGWGATKTYTINW